MTPQDDTASQANLIAFVTDPATIKKAVEGSMEKRQALMDKSDDEELREELSKAIWQVHSDNPREHILDDVIALISQKITEAYKQGYIAGGIDTLTNKDVI